MYIHQGIATTKIINKNKQGKEKTTSTIIGLTKHYNTLFLPCCSQPDYHRLQFFLPFSHEVAQTSFNLFGNWGTLRYVVQQGHNLFVEFANNTPRPLTVSHSFLPSFAESRRRDTKLLGSLGLWHVKIFGNVDKVLSVRNRDRIDDAPLILRCHQRIHSCCALLLLWRRLLLRSRLGGLGAGRLLGWLLWLRRTW